MLVGKKYFVIGMMVGIAVAVLFLYYFAPRYTTVKAGDSLIKQDRWSGDSWRFADDQWKKMMHVSRDWERIDDALMEALHLPTDGEERARALELLRKKESVLRRFHLFRNHSNKMNF